MALRAVKAWMRTSDPGRNRGAFDLVNALRSNRGFTLVEMLVALAVVGILLSLVAVRFAPEDRDRLRNEAERLAHVLDLAAEESRFSGKYIAWTADELGYRLWRLGSENEWNEIRDTEVLRAHTMPQGVIITGLNVEGMRAREVKRIEFSPGGAMLAFRIDLALGAETYAIDLSPVGDYRVSPGKGEPHAESPRL
jgi:general secretion pathway protein H